MASKREWKRRAKECLAEARLLGRELNTYSGVPVVHVDVGRDRPRIHADDAYGLMTPVSLVAHGQISQGLFREVLGEWLCGRRGWQPSDFGLESWPETPSPLDQAQFEGVHSSWTEAKERIVELEREREVVFQQARAVRAEAERYAARAEVERLKTELHKANETIDNERSNAIQYASERNTARAEVERQRPVINAVEAACDGSVGWRGDWLNVTRAWEKYMAELPDPDETVASWADGGVGDSDECKPPKSPTHDSITTEQFFAASPATPKPDVELRERIVAGLNAIAEGGGNPSDEEEATDDAPDRVWVDMLAGTPEFVVGTAWTIPSDPDKPSRTAEYLSRAYHDRLMREAADRAVEWVPSQGPVLGSGDSLRSAILEES